MCLTLLHTLGSKVCISYLGNAVKFCGGQSTSCEEGGEALPTGSEDGWSPVFCFIQVLDFSNFYCVY